MIEYLTSGGFAATMAVFGIVAIAAYGGVWYANREPSSTRLTAADREANANQQARDATRRT